MKDHYVRGHVERHESEIKTLRREMEWIRGFLIDVLNKAEHRIWMLEQRICKLEKVAK